MHAADQKFTLKTLFCFPFWYWKLGGPVKSIPYANNSKQHKSYYSYKRQTWLRAPQRNPPQWEHHVGCVKVCTSNLWGIPAWMFRSPSQYGTLKLSIKLTKRDLRLWGICWDVLSDKTHVAPLQAIIIESMHVLMAFVSKEISGLFTCELPWSISCKPRQPFQPLPTTVCTFHRTGEQACSGAMTTFKYYYRLKSFPKRLRVKK